MGKTPEKQRKKQRIENILKYKMMLEVLHREHLARGLTMEHSDLIQDAHRRLKELGYDWRTEKVKPFRKWASDEQTTGTKGWKPLEQEVKNVFGK
tara:strand:- start:1617 stop:1901 length:285 start_codon:yes stop_codon:yes gene_type:complete